MTAQRAPRQAARPAPPRRPTCWRGLFPARVGCWVAAALLPACTTETPTQTIVRFSASAELRPEADHIAVSIWNERGVQLVDRVDPVSLGDGDLARVPVVPRDDDPTHTFEIRAELLDPGGQSLGIERAVVGFDQHQLREVLLVFDEACRDVADCGAGRRCVLGQCVGACLDLHADSPHQETPATCGACERCSSGRCEALEDGAACGCSGDTCQEGDCVIARPVREVALGGDHSCARLEDAVYCWGANEHGQLGVDGSASLATPTAPLELDSFYRGVQAAALATCILGGDGTRHCFGENTLGQLGSGEVGPGGALPFSSDEPAFRDLTAGGSHFCGSSAAGQTWCFGYNVQGQLGAGEADRARPDPTRAPALDHATALDAGGFHTCVLSSTGSLSCVGFNDSGQLGVGDAETRLQPVNPGCAANTNSLCFDDWRQVSAGSYHTCAIRHGGALYCWGGNTNAQVGIGLIGTDELLPQPVSPDKTWSVVSAGFQHTCALDTQGQAFCWGAASEGQLGSGHLDRQTRPSAVVTPELDSSWVDIATSIAGAHTCAIASDGSLWCWGHNAKGQLAHAPEALPRAATPRRVCLPDE